MNSESCYWKQPLIRMANRFSKLKSCGDSAERQIAQVERDIVIGFYTVRKLIESITKLTDATKSMSIELVWHENIKRVTWKNNHRIAELYNLDIRQKEVRDIQYISSRVIHSDILLPCLDEHGLSGIFFASDRDKQSKIYWIGIDDVITIFNNVGNDYPVHIEYRLVRPQTAAGKGDDVNEKEMYRIS